MRTTGEKAQSKSRKPVCTRQRVMTLLVPVLAVTLVMLMRKPLRSPQPASADNLDWAFTIADDANAVQIDWEIPPLYQPSESDPMRLTAPTYVIEDDTLPRTEVRQHLTLRGVLYSEDNAAAMVGTQLMHEGDQIAGVIVREIEKNGVVFELNGERWKQMVSAPLKRPDSDEKDNRTESTGLQGNDDETPH
ncbi:MAG: general secretion pathway protein GspB [Phycisphaerales bacterium]|nr:MAG: general secretion pathway protein GspB [Phycisphaerales bacterium]